MYIWTWKMGLCSTSSIQLAFFTQHPFLRFIHHSYIVPHCINVPQMYSIDGHLSHFWFFFHQYLGSYEYSCTYLPEHKYMNFSKTVLPKLFNKSSHVRTNIHSLNHCDKSVKVPWSKAIVLAFLDVPRAKGAISDIPVTYGTPYRKLHWVHLLSLVQSLHWLKPSIKY